MNVYGKSGNIQIYTGINYFKPILLSPLGFQTEISTYLGKETVMITITIRNETERDRYLICQALSKVVVRGDIFFEGIPVYSTVMFLSKERTPICLRCKEIIYFEYMNRKIRIVTGENEYICINEKISDIANKMKPYGFAMCHQSFVINLYKVERICAQELVMKNGHKVYLAQKRAALIRKELRSHSGKILI